MAKNKKLELGKFTFTPIKKTDESLIENNQALEEAVNSIHRDSKPKVDTNINSEDKKPTKGQNRAPRASQSKKQPVVHVQVPTPKDLYMKIKGLVIDKEEIKGIKYLYLDAIEYYLKNKIYNEQKNTTSEL